MLLATQYISFLFSYLADVISVREDWGAPSAFHHPCHHGMLFRVHAACLHCTQCHGLRGQQPQSHRHGQPPPCFPFPLTQPSLIAPFSSRLAAALSSMWCLSWWLGSAQKHGWLPCLISPHSHGVAPLCSMLQWHLCWRMSPWLKMLWCHFLALCVILEHLPLDAFA